MKKHRGADALCHTLRAAGVTRIFTLSGNHIMPVFDAALDAGIELIHVRHEAAAVHMADAYARITGKPAVALVTGGPGHANAVSALYTAQMSESPVVLLSGHAPNDQLGMGSFQEMRQAEMAAPVTKASWTAASADSLSADVLRALREAAAGRPGPVHLSLPTDALESSTSARPETVGAQGNQGDDALRCAPTKPLGAATAASLLTWLAGGRQPLILTGPATLTRAGRVTLQSLEDACGVPVIGMESPRGVNDPALGAFAQMLAQADRVLLIGKKVDFTLKLGKAFAAACGLMQIDAEEAELARTRRAVGAVGARLAGQFQADAFSAIAALVDATGGAGTAGAPAARTPRSGWRDEVTSALRYRPAAWDNAVSMLPQRLHPVQVCRPLQSILDRHADAVLVSDGGEFGQWAQACLSAPRRIINGPAGAIGSALPFALGARMALRDAVAGAPAGTAAGGQAHRPANPAAPPPVIALMGDGTFGFHPAEIDTALRYNLPFVAIVGNDARWNAEYQIQLKSYGAQRLVGCELLPTRYDQVAMAFGGHGELVTEAAQLLPAVERAIASGKPACINVMMEGVPAPVVTRGQAAVDPRSQQQTNRQPAA